MYSPNDDPAAPKSSPTHTIDYDEENGAESESGEEPEYSGNVLTEAHKVGLYTDEDEDSQDLSKHNPQVVSSEKEIEGGEKLYEQDPPEQFIEPQNEVDDPDAEDIENTATKGDDVV